MKKTLVTSFIVLLALLTPAFAEEAQVQPIPKADLTASAQGTKDAASETKKPEVKLILTKKQKIEADIRATSLKLKLVIDRTQALIDLLNKNNKDTTEAQDSLDLANSALEDANSAIDQYVGIFPADTKTDSGEIIKAKFTILKDPLKKSQEALKLSKASLIESINSLKDNLVPKEGAE